MIGKKKQNESVVHPCAMTNPVPSEAGAPELYVRKTWNIGEYRVELSGAHITIGPSKLSYATLHNSMTLPKEYAAAVADALLQAS